MPTGLWPYFAGIAALVLVAAALIAFAVRRRHTPEPSRSPDLGLDLTELPPTQPVPAAPQVRCRGIAVRIVAVVLAPVGRGSPIPSADMVPAILDEVAPGIAKAFKPHQTKIKLWPPQLSSQGFVRAFFHHVRLPGDHGRGTGWCAAAGRCAGKGQRYLLGVAMCAAAPHNLGQIVVQYEYEWLDVLKARE